MAFSSLPWPFRRRGSGSGTTKPTTPAAAAAEEEEAEELGVTPRLLDFLRTLSPDTFKSSAHQLEGSAEVAAGDDLSDWQQRHAVLVLSKTKELAKIRYDLCPRHMKDKQFWRIYFVLAKSYILPYELRAIQKEKVRRMEIQENGKPKDVVAVEVEMQESKCSRESQTLPTDSEFEDS